MKVVARLEGSDAFKLFEAAHAALAKTLISAGNIDTNSIEVKRFDDGSTEWIIEMGDPNKAVALYNWLKESISALKDYYGFSRMTETKIDGTNVTLVYMPSPSGKEEFPAAFWVKGTKLYWYESGYALEMFEDNLYSEVTASG